MKNSIINLTLIGLSIFPSNKPLPLPESEQTIKSVTGTIVSCDFHELGSWGFEVFAGIQLNTDKAPYLRFNFLRTEWPKYQKWCDDKTTVKIIYQAKSTELRPEITYWGQDIKAIEENSAQK